MKRIIFIIAQNFILYVKVVIQFIGGGQSCIICDKKSYIYCICPDCIKKFYSVSCISDRCCKICGKSLISEDEICSECRNETVIKSTDRIYSLFSYRLWNIKLMCLWKLDGDRILSRFFSERICEVLCLIKKSCQDLFLVPVPPRPGKLKQKGWDQVKDICDYLKYKYGFIVKNALIRNSDIEQKSLDKKERLSTIGSSYSVIPGTDVYEKKICIIDDVLTTGATIECCANLLKKAGAKKVYALTLFCVDS